VSEETSNISVAIGGLLHSGATPEQIRDLLAGDLHPSFMSRPEAGPVTPS